MRHQVAVLAPLPGDVWHIPCLGRQHVQVIDVTPWRITLVHFPDVDRPIAATWWRWWFRYRCRDATFVCTQPLWGSALSSPRAPVDDGA